MTKILKIITNPNKILRKKSKDIPLQNVKSKPFQDLLDNMAETMLKKDGVGLAAPQIGENIRLFVINTKVGPEFFINPVIIKKSWAKETAEEGCLSVPNFFGKVKRHRQVVVDYINRKNVKQRVEATGLMARVIQHENDHLDGALFIDIATDIHEFTGEEND